MIEPIERANLRIIHHLGIGDDGKPNVADPACAERSRVMRLAGTVNGKTGAHARIVEADLALPAYPIAELVGDLPDPVARAAPRARRDGQSSDPYKRISPPEYFEKLAGIVVPRDGLVSCPASGHADRHPSCSVGTEPGPGLVLPLRRPAGRAARSTTWRRCCSAARGDASCAARRSSAPATTSPTCSAPRVTNHNQSKEQQR